MPPRDLTRSILTHYRRAEPQFIAAGLEWYDLAYTRCERLGRHHGFTATQSAVALAHLSPRVSWSKNLEYLELLLMGEPAPPGAFRRSWGLAQAALLAPEPLATFSRRARKTESFARAILGDANAVVVDVWTARAAGVEEDSIRRIAAYNAVVDAHRRGARIVGISARDLQAIVWCCMRGRAY